LIWVARAGLGRGRTMSWTTVADAAVTSGGSSAVLSVNDSGEGYSINSPRDENFSPCIGSEE
jgi:hypothetical protein